MNRQRRQRRQILRDGERNWLARLLDAAQRRFNRARPGSVLVMVVALLVMLALIGTAAMSTARLDRMSSVQHVANTEIDMLAESVKQMVIGQLVSDLFSPQGPNQTDSPTLDPDAPARDLRDAILSSRLPERLWVPTLSTAPAGQQTIDQATTPDPIWRSVSYPPMQTGSPYKFDPPDEDSSNLARYSLPLPKVILQPTFKSVNGEMLPAFFPLNPDGSFAMGRNASSPFVGADADGDGIADSLLFKLPISQIAGITYYGAIRVLDNNSAINLNTAWEPSLENTPVSAPSGPAVNLNLSGMFPGSVNLTNSGLNFVMDGNDVAPFAAQRLFGDYKKTAQLPAISDFLSGRATRDREFWSGGSTPTFRTDFVWLTPGDILHHQLGRRLENPGFWEDGNTKAVTWFGNGVRPFGIDTAMAMAYRFTLVNSAGSDSSVERTLPNSLLYNNGKKQNTGAKVSTNNWTPYTDVNKWFPENFDYPTQYAPNVRSLLTSINPTRTDVVRHAYLYAANPDDPYDPNRFPSKANPSTATFEELHQNFFDIMTKDGKSTPFDDQAGYQVSLDNPYIGMRYNQSTFVTTAEQHPARMFRSPIRDIGSGANHPSLGTLHPYQMLIMRSAIAALNTISLREPDQPGVLVPTRVISLPAVGGARAYGKVHIYGTKRQPFITEVYLNNNPQPDVPPPNAPPPPAPVKNQRGFVAIEIHNPYDTDLELRGWKIKVIERSKEIVAPNPAPTPPVGLVTYTLPDNVDTTNSPTNTGPLGTPKTLKQLERDTNFRPFTLNITIPPGGFVVLTNYPIGSINAPAPALPPTDPDAAQYLPAGITLPVSPQTKLVFVKTLHKVIGNEVVLTRPAADGTDAPADSFDATGMAHNEAADPAAPPPPGGGPGGPGQVEAWHYVRANDTRFVGSSAAGGTVKPGRAWNFVYPGRYDASNSNNRRQQGTEAEQWDPQTSDPWLGAPPATPIKLGDSDDMNSRERGTRPSFPAATMPPPTASFAIQIANNGQQDQFRIGGSGQAFPLNGFARTGDVMQATFIGSYTIEEDVSPDVDNFSRYVEVNSLPIDAAFAEDTDIYDDVETAGFQVEEIGRFAPLLEQDLRSYKRTGNVVSSPGNDTIGDPARNEYNDFWVDYDVILTSKDPTANPRSQIRTVRTSSNGKVQADVPFSPAPSAGDTYVLQKTRYGFATKLFDYFNAINAPADDYLPNASSLSHSPAPDPVRNTDPNRAPNRTGLTATPRTLSEDGVPVEGLVNINTANWKVLASLPLVLMNNGGNIVVDQVNTDRVAKRIVYFRDVDDGLGIPSAAGGVRPPHPHGPFKSVFELNILDQFATAENTIDYTLDPKFDPGTFYGDFSPLKDPLSTNPNDKDRVRIDFEEKYMNLIRLSNLLTTRSDAFTAYIQVQGWRDAGTANAKLVAQRRLAFIVDRSRVMPAKKTPAVYNVPTAN